MVIDYTITIGNIIEIATICGGGFAVFLTLKNNVANLKTDVDGIQTEIKKIGEVLITQADQNRRIVHLEDDVRELRHGHGFVRGPGGIDREFT